MCLEHARERDLREKKKKVRVKERHELTSHSQLVCSPECVYGVST